LLIIRNKEEGSWNLWYSGLLHHKVWWLDTRVSEDHAGVQPPH